MRKAIKNVFNFLDGAVSGRFNKYSIRKTVYKFDGRDWITICHETLLVNFSDSVAVYNNLLTGARVYRKHDTCYFNSGNVDDMWGEDDLVVHASEYQPGGYIGVMMAILRLVDRPDACAVCSTNGPIVIYGNVKAARDVIDVVHEGQDVKVTGTCTSNSVNLCAVTYNLATNYTIQLL